MGSFSIWHWLVVGVIVLLLFGGKGKISELMGDFAKGIKSFKKGMSEDDETAKPADPARIEPAQQTAAAAPAAAPATAPGAAPVANAAPQPVPGQVGEQRKVG